MYVPPRVPCLKSVPLDVQLGSPKIRYWPTPDSTIPIVVMTTFRISSDFPFFGCLPCLLRLIFKWYAQPLSLLEAMISVSSPWWRMPNVVWGWHSACAAKPQCYHPWRSCWKNSWRCFRRVGRDGEMVLRLEELNWLSCSHCSNHPVDVPQRP